MKPVYLFLLSLLMIACGKKDPITTYPPPPTTTKVKFMNACTNCGNVGIKINGNLLATSMSYLQGTDYLDVKIDQTLKLSFVDMATGNTLKEMDTLFLADYNYLVAFGGVAPDSLAIIRRAHAGTMPPTTRIQFYNFLVKQGSAMMFFVRNGSIIYTPAFTYGLGGYTYYSSISEGAGFIDAVDSNQQSFRIHFNQLNFETGKTYTAILSGRYGDTGVTKPKFTLLEDMTK